MPIIVHNQTYYRTAEVCQLVRISRNTLYRWLKHGVLGEVELRDRRGWRLFNKRELGLLKEEVNRTAMINRFEERVVIHDDQ